jgi:hypothetical protein
MVDEGLALPRQGEGRRPDAGLEAEVGNRGGQGRQARREAVVRDQPVPDAPLVAVVQLEVLDGDVGRPGQARVLDERLLGDPIVEAGVPRAPQADRVHAGAVLDGHGPGVALQRRVGVVCGQEQDRLQRLFRPRQQHRAVHQGFQAQERIRSRGHHLRKVAARTREPADQGLPAGTGEGAQPLGLELAGPVRE